jgi:hypothetical protein
VTFDVTNGRIPDVVEKFLRDHVCLTVSGPGRMGRDRRRLEMVVLLGNPTRHGDGYESSEATKWWGFDWPHDREPTLQEAIEAVMRG